MKTGTFTKRLCTATVCLALLCGMFCSVSFLPAAAVTESTVNAVDVYSVDFAELAALVEDAVYDTNGRYQSTMQDTEINEWVNKRFTLVFNREDKTPLANQKSYLGQSSFTLRNDHDGTDEGTQGDTWGSGLYWEIDKNGYLYHNTGTNHSGGEVARKGDALTLKTESGALAELTNAEVRVVFNTATNEKGMVYVALHEETPGYYPGGWKTMTSDIIGVAKDDNSTALLTALIKHGSSYNNGHRSDININNPGAYDFSGGLSANTDYELYVKAIGTTLTVKVTEVATDTVVYEQTLADTLTARKGYISVGTTRTDRAIKSIEVKELDTNGDPIDFGSNTVGVENFKFSVRDLIARNGGNYVATADTSDANRSWFTFYDGAAHAETDDAATVKAFLDSKFAFYYNSENIYGPVVAEQWKAYDGQTSDMAAYGQLYSGMWLQREYSSSYKENFRLISSMVPRGDDGEQLVMKNFETSFSFYFDGYQDTNSKHDGSAILGFRQQTAGKFVDKWYGVNKEQGFVCITRTGVTVCAGDAITSGSGVENNMYNEDVTWSYDDLTTSDVEYLDNSMYVTVKVVGSNCWVSLYKGDKTTLLWNNDGNPITVNYDKEGYLSYGLASEKVSIADITLTRLDDEGNPVDIDNGKDVETFTFDPQYIIPYNTAEYKYPAYVNGAQNNWYEFTGGTAMNASRVADTLDDKFDIYYNWDHFYTQVQPTKKTAFDWQDSKEYPKDVAASNYGWFGQLYNNKWLQRLVSETNGNETMRLVSSLVPRGAESGDPLVFRNFETTFAVNLEHTGHNSAVVFGFRQQTPGKFVDGYKSVNKEQAFVTVTYDGVTVAGGTSVSDDAYNKDLTYTFADDVKDKTFNVTVKAVGTDCWITITKTDGTVMFDNGGEPITVEYDTEGYIAYGLGSGKGSLGKISLTRLNEEGNPIDIEAVKEDTPLKEIAYVNAVNGEELKAGSLIATGVSGTKYIPQRVGFREGGDASAYTVDADEEVTWSYAFCQPTLTDPNIGNIGNSHNSNLNGLRFVSRFTREVVEGTEYVVTADGTQYAISDYGMLVSSQPGIAANTGKTANEVLSLNETLVPVSSYVQKVSIKTENKYYDVCDDHVDMAVTLINIDKVTGYGAYEDIQFYARPYVVVTVDGADTVLYGNVYNASYGDVAPMQ